MELYPSNFDWADHDCILIQDIDARYLVKGMPPEHCEIYVGHKYCAPATVIITVLAYKIPLLKALLEKGEFDAYLSETIRAMVKYAEAHPRPDGEYCFVLVEP